MFKYDVKYIIIYVLYEFVKIKLLALDILLKLMLYVIFDVL